MSAYIIRKMRTPEELSDELREIQIDVELQRRALAKTKPGSLDEQATLYDIERYLGMAQYQCGNPMPSTLARCMVRGMSCKEMDEVMEREKRGEETGL